MPIKLSCSLTTLKKKSFADKLKFFMQRSVVSGATYNDKLVSDNLHKFLKDPVFREEWVSILRNELDILKDILGKAEDTLLDQSLTSFLEEDLSDTPVREWINQRIATRDVRIANILSQFPG